MGDEFLPEDAGLAELLQQEEVNFDDIAVAPQRLVELTLKSESTFAAIRSMTREERRRKK